MKRSGVINWSKDRLKSIKRDLLFFDNLVYEEALFNYHSDSIKVYIDEFNDESDKLYLNELYATIEYLKNKKALTSYSNIDLKDEFYKSSADKEIILQIAQTVERIFHLSNIKELQQILENKSEKYNLAKWQDKIDLVTEVNLRYQSSNLNDIKIENIFIPLVEKFHSLTPQLFEKFGETKPSELESKEQKIIKLVINNIPTPDGRIPFDEILDFRNDSDNKRRYMGLTRWIRNMSKSSYNLSEIKEEIEYMTTDFEAYMKTQKYQYEMSDLEVFVKLPLEIAERFIKGNWSKLDESYLKIETNKMKLLASEMTAPSKELAFIVRANEKFKN